MSLLNDFGKSLTDGFGNFLRGYTNVAQKIGRGVSTAGLLTDVDNPEYQDGIQLTDIQKTYEKSKDISPGQAFLAASDLPSPFTAIRGAAQILGDKTPTMFKKDFNIYDEQQRKQAFQNEIVGKLASGSVDAVVTWFADPLVIGGKAIKIARVGAQVGKVNIPGLIEQRLPKTAEEISKAVTKGGWDRFLDEVIRPDMDASALLKNKTVRRSSNPELLASVFGNITDKEVGKTVLKAVLGDDASVKLLEKSANNADVAAVIKRQQRKIDKLRPNRDINAELLKQQEELLEARKKGFKDLAWEAAYSLDSLFTAFDQRQLQSLEETYAQRIQAAGEDSNKRAQLEAEFEAKREEIQKRGVKRKKALAMAEAAINTAVAITKTYAQFGFPFGLGLAAAQAAVGAVQIAAFITALGTIVKTVKVLRNALPALSESETAASISFCLVDLGSIPCLIAE